MLLGLPELGQATCALASSGCGYVWEVPPDVQAQLKGAPRLL